MIYYVGVDLHGYKFISKTEPIEVEEESLDESPGVSIWCTEDFDDMYYLTDEMEEFVFKALIDGYPSPKPGQYLKINTAKEEYELWEGVWDDEEDHKDHLSCPSYPNCSVDRRGCLVAMVEDSIGDWEKW